MDFAQLESLFEDLQGYALSRTGREKIGKEDDYTLTYGEVLPENIELIMETAEPPEGGVFYDLGCGVGKAVIFAAALHPFTKCVGIEMIDDLHAAAETAGKRFRQIRGDEPTPQVSFRLGDMFAQDLSDADLVFAHCTCFDAPLMEKLSTLVECLKPGAMVVTVTKFLPSLSFNLEHEIPTRMGWGDATIFFHRKR